MSGLVYFSGCWQDNLIKILFHVRVKLRPSCLQGVSTTAWMQEVERIRRQSRGAPVCDSGWLFASVSVTVHRVVQLNPSFPPV